MVIIFQLHILLNKSQNFAKYKHNQQTYKQIEFFLRKTNYFFTKMFSSLKLFYKIFSKPNIYSRKISVTTFNLYPRDVNKNLQNGMEKNNKNTSDTVSPIEKELETLNEVEANLFENSSNKYAPLKAEGKAILSKYRKDNKENKREQRVVETIQKVTKKGNLSRVVEDTELGLTYTRLELNHPLLTKMFMMVRSKKHRDKSQLILVEGRRLFLEAIECGLSLQTVLFSQKEQIALIGKDILNSISKVSDIYKVPQHDLKIWSALTTPPGVIGIFKRPTHKIINTNLEKYVEKVQRVPVTVICDNIREPNNLGSIIRSAAALPCSEILILKGCCDPWESKALRGGCGGQFRISLRDDVEWKNFIKNLPEASNIFISENNLNRIHKFGFEKKIQIYSEIRIKEDYHYYVIIGGETHGINEDIYNSILDANLNVNFLHIPLANGIDSLNATSALTLLLFEIRNKFLQNLNIEEIELKLDNKC